MAEDLLNAALQAINTLNFNNDPQAKQEAAVRSLSGFAELNMTFMSLLTDLASKLLGVSRLLGSDLDSAQ